MTPRHRLQLLGRIDLRGDQGVELRCVLAQPKRLALLAYLSLQGGALCRRDTLLGLFWPERPDPDARRALNKSVHFLRQALGDDAIVSRGADELGAAEEILDCDAARFRSFAAEGNHGKAMELYRGHLMPGFFLLHSPAFEQWLEGERAEVQRLAATVASAVADARKHAGDLSGAIAMARRAQDLAEHDEGAVRRLMELLDEAGDRAGALHAYDRFARRLAAEFNAAPSPVTQSIAKRLRTLSQV